MLIWRFRLRFSISHILLIIFKLRRIIASLFNLIHLQIEIAVCIVCSNYCRSSLGALNSPENVPFSSHTIPSFALYCRYMRFCNENMNLGLALHGNYKSLKIWFSGENAKTVARSYPDINIRFLTITALHKRDFFGISGILVHTSLLML